MPAPVPLPVPLVPAFNVFIGVGGSAMDVAVFFLKLSDPKPEPDAD